MSISRAIAPGGVTDLHVALFDSNGQRVVDYPSVFVQVECTGMSADRIVGPAAISALPPSNGSAVVLSEGRAASAQYLPCAAGTLAGVVNSVYRNGSAIFSGVTIFGRTGYGYSLRVVATSLVGPLAANSWEATVALSDCAAFERFRPALRACVCVAPAERIVATRECRCPSKCAAALPPARLIPPRPL